jgi:hypothetical protein
VSPVTTEGFNVTAKVGAVAAVMLSLLELPVSDAAIGFGVPPLGAVVSSMKLSAAVPVLPNVSVWLAAMVCGPSARPVGVNDHAPWASAVTVVAIGAPSIIKCTTVLGRPVPLNASFDVTLPLGEEAAPKANQAVTAGAVTGVTIVGLVSAARDR